MKLDHFVVHIDNDEKILSDLKAKIEPLGYPFRPKAGKGTRGFKAANSAKIKLPLSTAARAFIHQLFPDANADEQSIQVSLAEGMLEFINAPSAVKLELAASVSNNEIRGKSFSLLNTSVTNM